MRQSSPARRSKNTRETLQKNVKKDIDEYALIHGTQAVIKVFSKKYPTIRFNRTSVNYWKDRSKSRSKDGDYKKGGRQSMLDDA